MIGIIMTIIIAVIMMLVVIMLNAVIPRRRVLRNITAGWNMIFGRRKTGKTFFVRNFMEFDRFFFVERDGTVREMVSTGTVREYTWREFLILFEEILGKERIVIDEFHRLPEKFMDLLHAVGMKGELTLITSTIWLAEQLLRNSPLLGLVNPVSVGLIDELDILQGLRGVIENRELVESAVYLREPLLIPEFVPPMRDFLARYLRRGKYIIKGLLGEIFTEEGRTLTEIYDTILKSVANGQNISTEIASILYSRGLIPKDNPALLQKHLDILVSIGLLNRFKVFGKKKFRYYHSSPLLDLHYYIEAKYGGEAELLEQFVRKVIDERLPRHVEWFLRDLMGKKYQLVPQIIEDKEIDIALTDFNEIRVVAEVKWRKHVGTEEVKKVEEKLQQFTGAMKIMIVPEKNVLERAPVGIEVWDTNDIATMTDNIADNG
ncbi:MAG: ATPase [Candidatus Korarchaeota archaeon]